MWVEGAIMMAHHKPFAHCTILPFSHFAPSQTRLLDAIPSTPQHINNILRILFCSQNASQEKTKPNNTITKEEGNKEGPSNSGSGCSNYTRCSPS
jgi:hypothetical protein